MNNISYNENFLLRIGGISINELDIYSGSKLSIYSRQIYKYNNWLLTLKNVLLQFLDHKIKFKENLRIKYIEIKRNVFNDRKISQSYLILISDEKLRRYLVLWNSILLHLKKVELKGEKYINILTHEELKTHLELIKKNKNLENGILVSSPTLYELYEKYEKDLPTIIKTRHKKFIINSMKYLYRTAYKTSPLSTLTLTGTGILSKDITKKLQLNDAKVYSRLNQTVILRYTNNPDNNTYFIINPLVIQRNNSLIFINRKDIDHGVCQVSCRI